MDSIGALAIFSRAAEAQSFAAAARQVGLSPSAVAKTVTRLEDRLGTRLFHRNTRKLTMTDEGEALLESCQRIASEVELIEQRFAEAASVPRGKLRVSLPILADLFGHVLGEFLRQYPEVELDLDFSDRIVDVIDERFDIAIRTGAGVDSALMSRQLGTYSLLIVGSPQYFAHAGTPIAPTDLRAHICIHHKYPTTGKLERWPFKPTASGDEPIVPVAATATTLEPLITMSKAGAGITCLPDFAVQESLDDGSLVSILNEHLDHSNVFRAVWPSSQYLPLKTRVFLDFLAARLFRHSPAYVEAAHSCSESVR